MLPLAAIAINLVIIVSLAINLVFSSILPTPQQTTKYVEDPELRSDYPVSVRESSSKVS